MIRFLMRRTTDQTVWQITGVARPVTMMTLIDSPAAATPLAKYSKRPIEE